MTRKLGVWLVGANGGLATTVIAGAHMIARGLTETSGLLTETPVFRGIGLVSIGDLVFGGHEIRKSTVYQSAYDIHRETGTISFEKLLKIKGALSAVDAEIKPGTTVNAGATIEQLAGRRRGRGGESLQRVVGALRRDISGFRKRKRLDGVVVVNLASTEPILEADRRHGSLEALEAAIRKDEAAAVRASTLYAYAAIKEGCPFINFTPSNAATVAGICELGIAERVPFMGNDGKTGETLVKSALAPMFKYRNLKVLTWQGYNILGDRDGLVLADARHKASKISTKDSVLSGILGYPLHTHVGIDYVPSLKDMKTAWDFVHFQGFLDVKMSIQFIWQGCDAILAAPLVIDMVRLADLAQRLGEYGPMTQLACFFKRPLGVEEQDLHFQFHHLLHYIESHRSGRARGNGSAHDGGHGKRRKGLRRSRIPDHHSNVLRRISPER